jgi:voltage-gated potassium channel
LSETRIKLTSAVLSLLAIIIVGTVGLSYFEGMSLFNALWVTVVSLTTTGYGDILPQTVAGRAFLLLILVLGVGVVAYSLGAIVSILVETQISRVMERNKMMEEINGLHGHTIICGGGRVGQSVVQIMQQEKAAFVLIDSDEELVSRLQDEGHLVILGDATRDEVLLDAGIKYARGIVCALPNDAYNVFVTLSARALNPALKIVSRAEKAETVEKLRRAGADKIVAPAQLSGHRMAMAMLKPVSVDLVDTLFTTSEIKFQLEEILITENSKIASQRLKEVFKREFTNVIVVAIIRDGNMIMNPKGSETILSGDTLVMLGSSEDLGKLEETTLG